MISNDPGNMQRIYFENPVASSSLIGDWATTPANGIFTVAPVAVGDKEMTLQIFSIQIEMRLPATIDPVKLGSLADITNGIVFEVERGGSPVHVMSDPIKNNEDFELYFQKNNTLSDKTFIGPSLVYINYGFSAMLRSSSSDKITITSDEDLTGVANVLRFCAYGVKGRE